MATDDSSAAGFAVSAGVVGGDNTDPEIRYVELRRGELDGAFWDDEEALGDNFEELHRWLGISRDLHDDVMAWNAGPENWEEEQQLLRRLRDEVPARIEVATPRAVRPRVVRLQRLRVRSRANGERGLVEESGRAGERADLPAAPRELVDGVVRWREQRERFAQGDDAQAAAHFAWEDDGLELCRRLQDVWGPDYVVKMSG